MGWLSNLMNKFNPAQTEIAREEGDGISSTVPEHTVGSAFNDIEAINRGSSMIIHACASLDYDVKDPLSRDSKKLRKTQVEKILNYRPNPYQSAYDFRLNLFSDFLFEGMAFIYFDGAFVYHLPAKAVTIKTNEKTLIGGYEYNSTVTFTPDEVFSFKDVNHGTIYRGGSRITSALGTLNTLASMGELQKNFFDNGAVFGLTLVTDNTMSLKAKERTISYFIQKYNPKRGTKRPVILDNGLKPQAVAQSTFKDMDFDSSVKTHSERVLTALGVPPILLAGGNNANITPNLRLFYLETVLPIIRAYTSALERFFDYDIEPVTSSISALQPEAKDIAQSIATLVNGGIISANEGREKLRYPKAGPEHDEIRIPANIAGSATNPEQGGAPKKEDGEGTPDNGDDKGSKE